MGRVATVSHNRPRCFAELPGPVQEMMRHFREQQCSCPGEGPIRSLPARVFGCNAAAVCCRIREGHQRRERSKRGSGAGEATGAGKILEGRRRSAKDCVRTTRRWPGAGLRCCPAGWGRGPQDQLGLTSRCPLVFLGAGGNKKALWEASNWNGSSSLCLPGTVGLYPRQRCSYHTPFTPAAEKPRI
ncbi:hypothetical protein NN561_006389 [Cricetulus griseus]